MPETDFLLEEAQLKIKVDLQAGLEDALREACAQLLENTSAMLTIDLSDVKYIHSLSVGMLSYAWVEALSRDKDMNFIVSRAVADVFERTGLDKVFNFEVQE
jgi:anti-anti-sigma factor